MKFEDIPIPECYEESEDFRFFIKLICELLLRLQYDTENVFDCYDPLKCREELLWMLGDTIGYKYDDRLPASFNRLVILNFMDMIKKKGSRDGVTFAAELNLAQFNLINYAAGYEDENGNWVEGNEILYNRLEDTSIPVNAVYVEGHPELGYIEVVYFSNKKPIDACIEYVRPLGMYFFSHSGVRMDAKTGISIDARLTNTNEIGESIGSAHPAHYTREDYARLQKVEELPSYQSDRDLKVSVDDHPRDPVYYRNSEYEKRPTPAIDPGYRTLYSLQICNNDHVFRSLVDYPPIFSLGMGPTEKGQTYPDEPWKVEVDGVTTYNPKSYLNPPYKEKPVYNLRYDRNQELEITDKVYTLDEDQDPGTIIKPQPAVNPIMATLGDKMEINPQMYVEYDEENQELRQVIKEPIDYNKKVGPTGDGNNEEDKI